MSILKSGGYIAVLLFAWAGATVGVAEDNSPPSRIIGATEHEIPDWFKQSFLEIPEDAAEAAERNRHLMLFMHFNGCPYCAKLIRENFETGPNRDYIRRHFDCVALNVFGDREVTYSEDLVLSEKQLARHLEVLQTPTILFLDGDAEIVTRLSGYRNPERFGVVLEYVASGAYRTQSLGDYAGRGMDVSH